MMKPEFLRFFNKKVKSDRARLKDRADLLDYVLRDQKVPGRITNVESGPLLDLFNFVPDAGVTPKKIFDIVIANDGSAKILPQTGVVQIYLPKQERKTLLLEDLLKSSIFKKCRALLPVAIGVDVLGKPCVLDLSETRNILIDGRLGTGKTNLIISMMLSLATCKDSTEVTFVVVDTMNEYGVIDGLPHLSKRITDDNHVEELQKILDLVNARALNSDILHTPMILVIDKITDLTPESQQVVRRILQQGQSVGIYCIATGNKTVELQENLQAWFDTRFVFNLPESELEQILGADANALTLLSYGDAVYSIRSQQPERIHTPYIAENVMASIVNLLAKN